MTWIERTSYFEFAPPGHTIAYKTLIIYSKILSSYPDSLSSFKTNDVKKMFKISLM